MRECKLCGYKQDMNSNRDPEAKGPPWIYDNHDCVGRRMARERIRIVDAVMRTVERIDRGDTAQRALSRLADELVRWSEHKDWVLPEDWNYQATLERLRKEGKLCAHDHLLGGSCDQCNAELP